MRIQTRHGEGKADIRQDYTEFCENRHTRISLLIATFPFLCISKILLYGIEKVLKTCVENH